MSPPTPTRRTLLALLAAGTLALSGCGDDEAPGWDRPVEQAAPVKPFVVPAAIEQLIATELPTDGQVHVIRAAGHFDIKPETTVCRSRQPDDDESRFNGLAGPELFDALGQSGPSRQGGDRIRRPDDARCRQPTAVLIHGIKSDNRDGGPYKLVLAVWQGDTMWVAGIERPDGFDPNVTASIPYGYGLDTPEQRREMRLRRRRDLSISQDMKNLSAQFITSLGER